MPAGVLPPELYGMGDLKGVVEAIGKVVAPKTFNALELQRSVRENPALGITLASLATTDEGGKNIAKAYGIDVKHLPAIIGGSPADPQIAASQELIRRPGAVSGMADVLATGLQTEASKGRTALEQAKTEEAGGLGAETGQQNVQTARAGGKLLSNYIQFIDSADPVEKKNLMLGLINPNALTAELQARKINAEMWLTQFTESRADARALLASEKTQGFDIKDAFSIFNTIRDNQRARLDQINQMPKKKGESDESFAKRLQGVVEQYNTDSLAGYAIASQFGLPSSMFTKLEIKQGVTKMQHDVAKTAGFIVGGPIIGATIAARLWAQTDPEVIEVGLGDTSAAPPPVKSFNEALGIIRQEATAGTLTLDEIKNDPSGYWGTLGKQEKAQIESIYGKAK